MINSKATNLKQQIHDAILDDIISGAYSPNSVLHEKKLMAQYEVSRAPIREALVQLCSEGVLDNVPKKGYLITTLSAEDIKNIISFRQALECSFLQSCSALITAEAIEQLEELLSHTRSAQNIHSALEHWKNNIDFHLLLFSFYKNPFAYSKLQEALNSQTRYYAQNRATKWHSHIFNDPSSLHVAILDYIKQGNFTMAANILKADLEDISM